MASAQRPGPSAPTLRATPPASRPGGTSCTGSPCTSSSCASCSSCWARTPSCSCCASASSASSTCCCAAWRDAARPSCASAAGTTRSTAGTAPRRWSWKSPGARCACRGRRPAWRPWRRGSSWCFSWTAPALPGCSRSSRPFSEPRWRRPCAWSFWVCGWSYCKWQRQSYLDLLIRSNVFEFERAPQFWFWRAFIFNPQYLLDFLLDVICFPYPKVLRLLPYFILSFE